MKSPIYIDATLHRRAKASAAESGETLSEWASAATERELAHRAHRKERDERKRARRMKEGLA